MYWMIALSYAYAQFADETNWKFNKARQNWLLRNLWAESNVRIVHQYFLLIRSSLIYVILCRCRTSSCRSSANILRRSRVASGRQVQFSKSLLYLSLRCLLHLLTPELSQNLIKTCQDRLAMPVAVTSSEVDTSPTEAPQNVTEPTSTTLSTTSEAMHSRARTVLEALGVS